MSWIRLLKSPGHITEALSHFNWANQLKSKKASVEISRSYFDALNKIQTEWTLDKQVSVSERYQMDVEVCPPFIPVFLGPGRMNKGRIISTGLHHFPRIIPQHNLPDLSRCLGACKLISRISSSSLPARKRPCSSFHLFTGRAIEILEYGQTN